MPCDPSDHVTILGVPVTTIGMRGVVDTIGEWIELKQTRGVCACDIHSMVRTLDDEHHKRALGSADLVLPDGVSLVWVGQLRGKTQNAAGVWTRFAESRMCPIS